MLRGFTRQFSLHIRTPLVESIEWSEQVGRKVLLKLDALQPAGSFKIRGIGAHCTKAVLERGCDEFISSSGGNAGMAVAYSGLKLGIPVTVVVPATTPAYMRDKLVDLQACVKVHGQAWDDAHLEATRLAKRNAKAALVHPFEHPEIWEGHSTVISEVQEQLEEQGEGSPSAIVTVCGGGGLLIGLLQGVERAKWNIPVLACETHGASSLAQAIQAGKLVTLPAITSVAKSLGALTVSPTALAMSLAPLAGTKLARVLPLVFSDEQALKASYQMARRHRLLVEPACGAALAILEDWTQVESVIASEVGGDGPVVVLVCGGNMVDAHQVAEWGDIK